MAQSDPGRTVFASNGMVCSVDHLASSAGVAILRAGGSAIDAAVCTNAVLAVTTQHMCGMGGDLFALVHVDGLAVSAVSAVGRAGSGADANLLRAEGFQALPMYGDVRSATVPGCVDGWLALHKRFGRLPLDVVLAPAREYAVTGFPASPLLARATKVIAEVAGADDYVRADVLQAGDRVKRPLLAEAFDAVVTGGRNGFYGGFFGKGLLEIGDGLFTDQDLRVDNARWETPLHVKAWGHNIWTVPPPSQGYLGLAGAWIAEKIDLPVDPDDPSWVHLLSEVARWVGHDRPDVLFDGADGAALLSAEDLGRRLAKVDQVRRRSPTVPRVTGGTVYLCAVDGAGMGVSLIQSNAAGWGCRLVVPGTGIFLQNRGIGFNLIPGHPGELGPGRRPAHTLAPALLTDSAGALSMVLGTQGGDIQPQVILQLLARMLRSGQSPDEAVRASRWFVGDGGFSTWSGEGADVTSIESTAPWSWEAGLAARDHAVVRAAAGANFGHAQVIMRHSDGTLAGAADPRAMTGAAIGY